jgi:hypothetical protein
MFVSKPAGPPGTLGSGNRTALIAWPTCRVRTRSPSPAVSCASSWAPCSALAAAHGNCKWCPLVRPHCSSVPHTRPADREPRAEPASPLATPRTAWAKLLAWSGNRASTDDWGSIASRGHRAPQATDGRSLWLRAASYSNRKPYPLQSHRLPRGRALSLSLLNNGLLYERIVDSLSIANTKEGDPSLWWLQRLTLTGSSSTLDRLKCYFLFSLY